jgi:hypothetical protein
MKNEMHAEASRYYKENPKGVETVCKIIEEMCDEIKERTKLEDIRTIMKNLKLTAEQAMKALAIPASDKEKYLVKL